MDKNVFTKDFYEKLYDAVVDEGKDDIYYEDICEGRSVEIECKVGDILITAKVHYITELHDDSFDHAFGTWHDPCPYYEVCGCDDIEDVHVYENEDNDSPEIKGFSEADFWSQFDKDRCDGIKAGDKVHYGHCEVTFVSYNTEKDMCKIVFEDGREGHVMRRFLSAA